jgi:acyl-CoA thioester hydrolase
VRIYWEDTDAGGVVFYANYLKFFERARTEWLRTFGPGQESFRQSGQGMFVVTDTRVRYRSPARLDDQILITVRLMEIGRASLVITQQAVKGHALLADGEIRIGWVKSDAQGLLKPARLPAEVLAGLPGLLDDAQSSPAV